MKIVKMRGMLASGLVLPSKWVGRAVRANRMHRQCLERRPQNFFAILMSESGSPKQWFAIAHENYRNEVYARFGACLTFKMCRTDREGQPDSLTRS